MNRIDEIKQRILDTKIARQMLKLDEYDEVIDDFEYLLQQLEVAQDFIQGRDERIQIYVEAIKSLQSENKRLKEE